VTTYFPNATYSDGGAGGLHCFGGTNGKAGSILIPPGTYTVSAGGIPSNAGTMLVQFSDGQKMFENANNYSCGQYNAESPIFNSKVMTFTGPVTATLYFEMDTGTGAALPINSPFITYTVS
jgi:hypothetical protein